ncbi:HCO3 transporter family-domain-containing protein [Boeremia exigua]|uniref:HCO3 transporter family-domain-containing protein n=1 Tax=Boeremia exigua TaxID=749465 RepID=UPI001E8DBC49|nr:HCO3 transporter family-domain-containing protein [Boeremia exigua]KAH6642477.1 HCO3 transporter family-domain-containing protein [Boeremia exigua]
MLPPDDSITVPEHTRTPSRRSRTSSFKSRTARPQTPTLDPFAKEDSKSSNAWYKTQPFSGMLRDIKRRAPFYASDWTDAWDYRVVPATVYMYFANILPALAFSLDMFAKTDSSFGVNEVLLASVLGSVVFSLFAAQPLVIVGVTGPITVFNYTVFGIVAPRGIDYFAFMGWVGVWALLLHWVLAALNSCNLLRYVTRFSCDIFGFYVACIYLQKGVQVLTRQWEVSDASAYLSVMIALLVTGVAYLCGVVGQSALFPRPVRKFIDDYGTPLTVVFFTGFVHVGKMAHVELLKLPTSRAFFPTSDRSWLVRFWDLGAPDVFLALPFAIVLTILFWFDHNVSSLIAQGTEFPLRKPAGFHWDIFLLGLTTGVAGLLGVPFPNGLIPQAPFHTASLCTAAAPGTPPRVVEQRASNLAQGLLTLATMSAPLLTVLHLIPQAVLAGLFFVMGIQALEANGITAKLVFLLSDPDSTLTPPSPLARVRRRAVWAFVALELLGFGVTFALTQTDAAIGFPVCIFAYIPLRAGVMPRWFAAEELAVLDQPAASAATMEGVGGIHGQGGGMGDEGGVSGDASGDEALEVAERGEGEGVVRSGSRSTAHGGSRRRASFRAAEGEVSVLEKS